MLNSLSALLLLVTAVYRCKKVLTKEKTPISLYYYWICLFAYQNVVHMEQFLHLCAADVKNPKTIYSETSINEKCITLYYSI